MRSSPFVAVVFFVVALAACNTVRKQECEKFLSAMSPMQEDTPSIETVDRVRESVESMQFQDEPLHEYGKNYRGTLTVLSSTLKLKSTAGPDGPPDGTDDVIKTNLKDARTDYDDISRYCSE
jgi:hypothetical protein